MAIKKNGSRNSDRVRIRRMNAEGFSIHQIAEKLSITEDHVTLVLEKWPTEVSWRDAERAQQAEQRERLRKFYAEPAAPPTDAALEARIRKQVMDELRASGVLPSAASEPVASYDEPAGEDFPDGEDVNATGEGEATVRRRRRAVV